MEKPRKNIALNTFRIILLVLFVNGFGMYLQNRDATPSPSSYLSANSCATPVEIVKATVRYHVSRVLISYAK